MAAAAELPLAKDALLAAAVAATLLAFSRHAADQPVLASRDATAVLLQLLQVRSRLGDNWADAIMLCQAGSRGGQSRLIGLQHPISGGA